MLRMAKWFTGVSVIALIAGAMLLTPADASRGSKPASVTCTVNILFEFRAQNGALLFDEIYTKSFVLKEGAFFEDDYSTATRFKSFSATLERVGKDLVVKANWFDDVGVFDSIDLSADVTLSSNEKSEKCNGSLTHSSTPGHAGTTFVIDVVRN